MSEKDKTEPIKNFGDMKEMLADSINKVRTGEVSPSVLNPIVNACGKIISATKMELELAKALGLKPNVSFIQLGEPKEEK